jgi:multisubunit Na+/H+ antiporter MnhG subunit
MQDVLQALAKPARESKKAVATRFASLLAFGVAVLVCGLLAYQITHGQPVDWSGAGIFAVLVIAAVTAPAGVQVMAQGRVDREVLTELARGQRPPPGVTS